MPEMRGTELVARLREDRPDLPAVLISGYTASTEEELNALADDILFVSKPVSPNDLARRILRPRSRIT
jgi:CheY-like chemotaxis protein